jgi:hypothetical protein
VRIQHLGRAVEAGLLTGDGDLLLVDFLQRIGDGLTQLGLLLLALCELDLHRIQVGFALAQGLGQLLLLALAAVIFMLFAPPAEGGGFINPIAFQELGEALSVFWSTFGGWTILYAIELVVLALLGGLFSISMIHFCITIGAIIAKKAKLLAAIGIYYAINMAFTLITQVLGTVSLMVLIEGYIARATYWSPNEGMLSFALILLTLCGMMGVLATLFYNLTLDRIERRLNLA